MPKATYKTNKARILVCATFRRHAVKRDVPPSSGKGVVLGKEKTCPTFQSQGTCNLFYTELENSGSNLGLTAPLSGMSRGELPLSQPPGHLGHQGFAGQFPVSRLGESVHRLPRPERTEFAGSPDFPGPDRSSRTLGPAAGIASIAL